MDRPHRTLGRWVAAGALGQAEIEEALYAAAERTGLVGDDGQRPTRATSRSGLGAGLRAPLDLDAERRARAGRARGRRGMVGRDHPGTG
jgi:hypothetical protein